MSYISTKRSPRRTVFVRISRARHSAFGYMTHTVFRNIIKRERAEHHAAQVAAGVKNNFTILSQRDAMRNVGFAM